MYKFDVKKVTDDLIKWILDWFEKNGKDCNAVLGMSGGKDSTIAAALLAKALGPERVIGVAMPDTDQSINDADKICKYLGIKYMEVPIWGVTGAYKRMVDNNNPRPLEYDGTTNIIEWSKQTEQNIPPRIRMTTLFAIAQTWNGRVIETCNLSESYIGYLTIFGDGAGVVSPLGGLTVTEILRIGDYIGLPYEWVHKTPDDGLPHSTTDEAKIGFSYAELDRLIRESEPIEGVCTNDPTLTKEEKIYRMYYTSDFKRKLLNIPTFKPNIDE